MHIKKAQELDLSLEDVLLLSCAQSKLDKPAIREIDFILDNDLDWEHILDMATRHRLLPLLYINLNAVSPSKVPVDILRNLKTNFHDNARRNLLLTGELIKVMQLLEEEGVQAVTYKGPVLAYSAYGNVGYRKFGDIDIFIKKSTVSKAKKVLLENGYYLDPPIEVDDSIYMKLDTEYRFRSDSGALIELNWGFAGHFFYFPHNPGILFEKLMDLEINNFKTKTPSPESEFLMLVIHCAKHDWKRLSWLCDVREVIENKKLNWDEIWKNAHKLGVKRIVSVTLHILESLFGCEVPEWRLDDKNAKILAIEIINRKFVENKDSWNLLEKFFLDFRKRDKNIYGIMDCIYGLTKPTNADIRYLNLPKFLFPIYFVLRPFFLIKRYHLLF